MRLQMVQHITGLIWIKMRFKSLSATHFSVPTFPPLSSLHPTLCFLLLFHLFFFNFLLCLSDRKQLNCKYAFYCFFIVFFMAVFSKQDLPSFPWFHFYCFYNGLWKYHVHALLTLLVSKLQLHLRFCLSPAVSSVFTCLPKLKQRHTF